SALNKWSLVRSSCHSKELLELIAIEPTGPVIEYIVSCVSDIVDHAMVNEALAPSDPPRGRQRRLSTPFYAFVSTVLKRSAVSAPTVLTALVYIHRARGYLSIALEEWAHERLFLGALIVASKYTNNSTLKNVHWSLCTGVFGKHDVGVIEREFLEVLDWELGIGERDLLEHYTGVM
ncbi:hypothetical protein B0H10DRAFT_1685114, partial [Mycena sp. CBHHK59/15]